MTGDQTVTVDPKDVARDVRALLNKDRRFEDVGYAYAMVDVDERERIPNCLSVMYMERQFFIRFRGTGVGIVERAEGRMSNTRLGEVDGLEGPILADKLVAILDEDIAPPVMVSGDGDRVIPPAGKGDEDKLPSDLHHETCGYSMEGRQTTAELRAYHCRGCGLRIVLPLTVKTWGDLRRWSKAQSVETLADTICGRGWLSDR